MFFRNPPRMGGRGAIVKYLESDLWTWLKDVSAGLLKMNFAENFESFRYDDLIIKAGQEVLLANQLKNRVNGVIPSSRIIVRQIGNSLITDGDTAWTQDLVSLKNQGVNDVTISVIFFK